LGGLAYGQSLSCGGDLNGIEAVVGATDERGTKETKGTKAEEQKSSNTATSEHVCLLTLLANIGLETDHDFTGRVCLLKGRRREAP
jgi:hypothetical protein